MALPTSPARALALAAALALAGCGGVPKGPVLPDGPASAPASADARARAMSLTRIADTALRSGDAESAVGLFQEATLTDQGSLPAALGLGEALLVVGRDLEATRAFERAMAIAPQALEARYGYARAMIAINRPEVAADQLRALVDEAPTNMAALNALGVAQDLLGDHAAAEGTYRQALTVMPASEAARNNLALSLALQDRFKEALDLLRPLAEGPNSTRRSRQNLALVFGLQGDMAAAERVSRIDLGGEALASNLAYFAALRGMEAPSIRALALAPEHDAAPVEPRLTRRSRPAGNVAPAAAPASSGPARDTVPAAPRPLVPVLGQAGADVAPQGEWFVDLGTLAPAAASETWRRLRAEHGSSLSGLERLAGAGAGPEPMLVGPLASEQSAADLCGRLGTATAACRPTRL